MLIDQTVGGRVAAARPTAILILATLQGLVLYGLHRAIDESQWPATQLVLLFPLYLLTVLLPLTAQLLIRHRRDVTLWRALAIAAVLLAAMGWFFARSTVPSASLKAVSAALVYASALPLTVLWLVLVAFLRARLEAGHWRPAYPALFAAAWRNKLTLLEAGLFVGLFWLLLALWAALFNTLQIRFFTELFKEPLFVYPVTAIAFGLALHLIGSVDRLVDVVLAQVLNLLKWLAPLAALIVVLFSLALLSRLPDLLANAQRPLSATWLLWTVAVTLLLLNAAYQDGTTQQPWFAGLARAMRVVPPLMLVIALTALYAIWVRIDSLGFTVSRFWGVVTAGIAVAHSLAYTWAALRRGPWMQGISHVNPLLAALLCAMLLLSLSPVLSPYRLAAASQSRIAIETTDPQQRSSALKYLRFGAAGPGDRALQAIAMRSGDAASEALAAAAHSWLQRETRWSDPVRAEDYGDWRKRLQVHPAGHLLPPELEAVLQVAVPQSQMLRRFAYDESWEPHALWADLAGDTEPELVLFSDTEYLLFARTGEGWGEMSRGSIGLFEYSGRDARRAALAADDFAAQEARIRDLRIGEDVLRLFQTERR